MTIKWCGHCQEECDVFTIENGIGRYEFWGQKGNDSHKQCVSECCEAQAYDDPDCRVEAEPMTKADYEN